jgi:hypothetical protein
VSFFEVMVTEPLAPGAAGSAAGCGVGEGSMVSLSGGLYDVALRTTTSVGMTRAMPPASM